MVDVLGLLLLGGAVGIGGAVVAREQRARRNFVTGVRTEWTRSGQIVRYGPVGAFYYGSRPQRKYFNRAYGALGITRNSLVFEGHRKWTGNILIRIKAIRWIGVRIIMPHTSGAAQALIIHSNDFNRWSVHIFTPDQFTDIAEELSRYAELPLHQLGTEREDYGSARAQRMIQDIYGEWSGESNGELYLAPDRLLFDWEDAVLLSQIREIGAFVKGGLNPFATDLLRIEYESPDSGLHTVGFLMRDADQWAEVIQSHTGAPLNIQAGRKKKET
jgi:hypothetical protein